MQVTAAFVALLAAAQAEYHANINYRSPSHVHNLAISIPKVMKRHGGASHQDPAAVNFTHGVASGDPYAESVILWVRAIASTSSAQPNTPRHEPVQRWTTITAM